jgi:hypothetical protein
MSSSSFHPITKTPSSKKPLKFYKEILYALCKKIRKCSKLFSEDSGLFDTLPLKRGLKECSKIREGGEKGKIQSKKRQMEECFFKISTPGKGKKGEGNEQKDF